MQEEPEKGRKRPLKGSGLADSQLLTEDQAQVEPGEVHQETFQNVGVVAQVSASHPPGFVAVSKRAFDSLAPGAQEPLAAGAPDPPPVAMGRLLGLGLVPPAAAAPSRTTWRTARRAAGLR